MLTPRRSPSGGPPARAARRRAARRAYGARVAAAVALVGLSAWWALANPVPGGGILVSFDDRHGVDVTDLAALPLLALAAWLVWPRRRRRSVTTPMEDEPATAWISAPPVDVLIVCSANQCRSPMAAALLRHQLDTLGVPAHVRSAGTSAEAGLPALDEAQAAVGGLEAHRTTALDPQLVEQADLVLGMTRHHVREAVLMCPDAFARTFTVFELARRGRATGPRRPDESLEQWLARVGAGRSSTELAGTSETDEMPDPIGLGAPAISRSAAELGAALDEIAGLAWGNAWAAPRRVR